GTASDEAGARSSRNRHKSLLSKSSYDRDVRLRVDLLDHRVPGRNEALQVTPERLARARRELVGRGPLLLDPGEVAEVEDPLAAAAVQLDEVVRRRAQHVLAEGRGGVDGVERAAVARRQRLLDLARVHLGAV